MFLVLLFIYMNNKIMERRANQPKEAIDDEVEDSEDEE
jgi:hypothetical protein